MPKKRSASQQQISDLTSDLQRVRADFENYRKRTELEKQSAQDSGYMSAIMKLLPVVDTIERAVGHIPDHLKEDAWANGVAGLSKQLEKTLLDLGVARIQASAGTPFDPQLHQAVQFDESSDGAVEVIADEMQSGYTLHGVTMRPSMVKVKRQ